MPKAEKLTPADVEAACRALVQDAMTYTDAQLSPDLADAFVLTFAVDAITLARGRDRDGGKPVERRIRWMAT